jgi:hypothetical protein
MKSIHCGHCGAPIARLAVACGHCGAPNPARRRALVMGATLSALLIVVVVGGIVLLAGGPADRRGTAVTQPSDGDYGWLEAAMKQCDEQAAQGPKAVHYLVTPLVDEPRDDAGWRRISINDIGNAILINSDDMLAGLRRKALRINPNEYVFSVRNEKTRDVLTWKPSTGVRKFVINDAEDITQFKVQFQSNDVARAINWGATFERQPGNCYWVNAILRQ